jgi:hypothetical protein
MRSWNLTAGNRPGVCALPRYVAGRRGKSTPNYPEPERLRLEIPMFGKTKIALFLEAGKNTPRHWIGAAFSTPNSSAKSVGRPPSFGLLVATTAATLLCGDGLIASHARRKSSSLSDRSDTHLPVQKAAQPLPSPSRRSFITSRRPRLCATPSARLMRMPPLRCNARDKPIPTITPLRAPRPSTKQNAIGSFPPKRS